MTPWKLIPLLILIILASGLSPLPGYAQDHDKYANPIPELLPRDLEIELALSAIPKHLREDATVYALERGGYVKVQEGTSGISCLVRRSGVTQGIYVTGIGPQCFDKEGTRTMLQVELDHTVMIEQGMPLEDVYRKMKEGFATGRYEYPKHGVVYMLSAANLLPQIQNPPYSFPYIPHLMFYAPNMQPDAIGMEMPPNPFGQHPFIPVPGEPWSYIVVPLGEKERAEIAEEQADLVERAKQYVLLAQ